MNKFRVKEKFIVTVYTYIEAETLEHAKKKLVESKDIEDLDTDFGSPLDEQHMTTLFDTLEEAPDDKKRIS